MKYLKYIFLGILSVLFFINPVFAKENEKNIVNLYLFYSKTCPHCAEEEVALKELEEKYDNLVVYSYEIHTEEGINKLHQVENYYDITVNSVPFTVIGEKKFHGYSSSKKLDFDNVISYYSDHGYKDEIGELLGIEKLPTYLINENDVSLDDYVKKTYNIDIPLIGKIDLKQFTIPVITIMIGLLDGFNPCAMWVLLFLISMLLGMKDKKRMWSLGVTFIFTSSIMYFAFMMAWLNVTKYLSAITWIQILIGLVAIVGGIVNLRSYLKERKVNGCQVVDDKKRNKIFDKIKKFTTEKSFLLATLGVITLAISVNLVDLLCSAGLPVMYIEILSMNGLSTLEYVCYLIVYVLFFMLDDIIVFFIAMTTMQVTGFSTKYGKFSHLIGGILLLLIGIIMILKPEWLMFNFS